MQDEFEDIVPKHLARNVPLNFQVVCERIRHREQIFTLKYPKRGAAKYQKRYGELLAALKGTEKGEPSASDFYIGQELDEIRVRFLAVIKTVDQTVSVKLVFDELRKAQNALHRAVKQLDDPYREELVQYYSEGQGEASLATVFEGSDSLVEKVSYAHRYLAAVSSDIDKMTWFFNYKYNKTARGNPSKFALTYVVFALADVFEKYSGGRNATVNETLNDGSDGRNNARRYTGNFLKFVLCFIAKDSNHTGHFNIAAGLEDQIRKLAKARRRDPELYKILHKNKVDPQDFLKFMKLADAVK